MDSRKTIPSSLVTGVGVVAAAVGGWIAYSKIGIDHRVPLPPAINADQEQIVGAKTGLLSYYVDRSGSGRPLVLIHSINAAASAYEMKPLFDRYRGQRPVYALDLPGFGFSERTDRVYSPQLYTEAILDLLAQRVKEPADVIAFSLGCEFAAQAAVNMPDLFHSLTFISPTGFTEPDDKPASQRASESNSSNLAYRLLSFPVWSQAFYDLLTTRPSIRWFFKTEGFEGTVDQGLADYCYLTSHQPGARYAPLYFVSGKLFTPNIFETVYEQLKLPVLVLYNQAGFVTFDRLPEMLARHDNWRTVQIPPAKGLLQFEKPLEATQALDAFWLQLE